MGHFIAGVVDLLKGIFYLFNGKKEVVNGQPLFNDMKRQPVKTSSL